MARDLRQSRNSHVRHIRLVCLSTLSAEACDVAFLGFSERPRVLHTHGFCRWIIIIMAARMLSVHGMMKDHSIILS